MNQTQLSRRIVKRLGQILGIYLVYVTLTAVIWPVIKPMPEKVEVEPSFIETNERVTLLEYGIEAFGARMDSIDAAEETIDVSYYYMKEGKSVDIFHAYVLAAAERGVKVRYLLDGISHGVRGEDRDVIHAFNHHPNITFKLYEPITRLVYAPWRINNRMHDKMLIVDGKYAVSGGRNISDVYYERTSKDVAYSHDRDVFLMKTDESEGLIDQMMSYYNELFDSKYAVDQTTWSITDFNGNKAEDMFTQLKQYYDEHQAELADREPLTSLETWEDRSVEINRGYYVSNELTRGFKTPYVWSHLLELSSRAEEHLFIQSPWVIPNSQMREDIESTEYSTDEGVLLTNGMSTNSNALAHIGTENRKPFFIDSFLDYYEYQPTEASLHTKTWVFDKQISAIGSYNFDARSSYLSTESMIIIDSEALAEQLLEESKESFLNKSGQIYPDGSISYGDETEGEEAGLG
ncbi:MAG: phospholipase D family protein, partial [Alkalibacterium sp.]